MEDNKPVVGIIMGSDSDLPTMKAATEILNFLGIVLKRLLYLHIAHQ